MKYINAAFIRLSDIIFFPIQKLLGIKRMGYFFVLPNLLVFGIFIILPMLLNFYYAFTSGQQMLPQNRRYAGTDNFEQLLDCENFLNYKSCDEDKFWRAIHNTLLFVTGEVVAIVAISLLTALVLNQKIRGRGFFRSVFFYPVLLSPIVVAMIWKWILQYENGVLNIVLLELGQDEKIPFLLEADWAKFWTMAISVWAQMGFYTLIFLAGLQAIPSELYEAGDMDGAGTLSRFFYITLPLLRPTLLVVLVLSLIRAVQVFDHVFVLTGGAPGTATLYTVQYIYTSAFQDFRYGIASAASVMLALVLMIVTFAQLAIGRRQETA